RMALHQAIRQRDTKKGWRRPWRLLETLSGRLNRPYRWALATSAVLLLVVLGGTGVVAASSGSLPDQPLYPVKRVVERMRLVLTLDKEDKANMYAAFANRRVEEMAVMGTKGDEKRVLNLIADVKHHLRQVQHYSFPGVFFADLGLTDLEPGATPQIVIPNVGPGKSIPFDRRRLPTLRRLNMTLENGLQNQDRVLLKALLNAPALVKEDLTYAHQTTRQNYTLLIRAIQIMTEEVPDSAEYQR
ncbi:MAG: DUF5667 domain-containing protein, partial [Dehalococcoidia bacterium]